MKTVLITISKEGMRRNTLDTDFWPQIKKENPDTRFVLVVQESQVDYINAQYGAERVSVRGYKKSKMNLLARISSFGVRTCLNTHSAKRYRMMDYELGNTSWFFTMLKTFIADFLAPHTWYKRFTRNLVLLFMQVPDVVRIFDEEKPDLVFTPSLIDNAFDVPFAVEAKRRGIRVVGMMRSWDNPTSHSLIGVTPDRMLYQNKWLQRISTGPYQRLETESHGEEDIVGLPHYDVYKDPTDLIIPRDTYFKEKGLDPNKKLILIAGSQLYRSGDILPRLFETLIAGNHITGPVQALFRPHPKHRFSVTDYGLDGMKYVVLDTGSQSTVMYSDAQNFVNALYHSDVVIGVSSTITIDAAVFDKPVVDVCFDDPKKEIGYWASVERLFDTEDHYERVSELAGSSIARTEDELVTHVNAYLSNPQKGHEGRKRVIEEFVAPFDGCAGKRWAHILTDELNAV